MAGICIFDDGGNGHMVLINEARGLFEIQIILMAVLRHGQLLPCDQHKLAMSILDLEFRRFNLLDCVFGNEGLICRLDIDWINLSTVAGLFRDWGLERRHLIGINLQNEDPNIVAALAHLKHGTLSPVNSTDK